MKRDRNGTETGQNGTWVLAERDKTNGLVLIPPVVSRLHTGTDNGTERNWDER